MNAALATTWNPRGEEQRLLLLLPILHQSYTSIVIVFRPEIDVHIPELLQKEKVILVNSPEWGWGRYLALKTALATDAEVIHYADMDRLLRWVETRPEEWKESLLSIQSKDCVVFGRTEVAYQTHPEAMIQTEQISNLVTSYFIGQHMDVSAGSKVFSRKAASFLLEHTQPRRAIGTDAEWLILLKRAGFMIDYVQVDGLDYESADRYQSQAADAEQQRLHVAEVDANPQQWARRVEIALEIVQSALDAQQVIISRPDLSKTSTIPDYDSSTVSFDITEVFEVDDYLYFYSEALTEERTEAEVAAIVKMLHLEMPMNILDLACGYGRHTNHLAAMGHQMTGIDIMPGFLEIAKRDAQELGVEVCYRQEDMRRISYQEEYDCVLLIFTAFGYFNDNENQQVLRNIQQALKPGGRIIFDTPNRDVFLKHIKPCFIVEKEGNLMIDRISFDALTGHSINRRTVIRDGFCRDKPFKIRLYNPDEIEAYLEEAGFETEQIYGGWDEQLLSPDSQRMIIIGRKPGN